MTVHEQIKVGIPEALKAGDNARLRTLRSLASAMTNEVVAKKRKPNEYLTDEEALIVLKRAASQRKDSIQQFEVAGRTELSKTEKEELEIITGFLPASASREAIEEVVRAKIAETGLDKSKVGQLMGAVMKELRGNADGTLVKEVIDSLLS